MILSCTYHKQKTDLNIKYTFSTKDQDSLDLCLLDKCTIKYKDLFLLIIVAYILYDSHHS